MNWSEYEILALTTKTLFQPGNFRWSDQDFEYIGAKIEKFKLDKGRETNGLAPFHVHTSAYTHTCIFSFSPIATEPLFYPYVMFVCIPIQFKIFSKSVSLLSVAYVSFIDLRSESEVGDDR